MPEKQKQIFLNPKGEFPGRTQQLMKDLKAHKKDSFPPRAAASLSDSVPNKRKRLLAWLFRLRIRKRL